VVGVGGSAAWIAIARGLGGARFAAPRTIDLGCLSTPEKRAAAPANDEARPPSSREVAWEGDVDGAGPIEIVTRESVDTGKSDMKQANETAHALTGSTTFAPISRSIRSRTRRSRAEGWAFSGPSATGSTCSSSTSIPTGGRTSSRSRSIFSMFQALRALTAKKIGVGLEFHVVAQQADGSFRLVPDQKLDEKLNLDPEPAGNLATSASFQGDFDGDGRVDFVHLGRGKTVTIHRGQAGGRYSEKPDLAITLDEEPEDVMLVRVRDFDGDDRSDLAITRTLAPIEAGATAPTRLELNLSGEGR
jgi:hypothetical protein